MPITLGLDVGGAHLKMAKVEHGQLTQACQFACPLWQGLDHLDTALTAIETDSKQAANIAITMTGELSDIFENRAQGVQVIVDRLHAAYGQRARFWAAPGHFVSSDHAKANPHAIGSMNYLATAAYAATHHEYAILMDMGTTTTDIITILDGKPAPQGLTDPERLRSGELVYTGLTRTAVMSITDKAPIDGAWAPICREYLATMADVRRVLKTLPPDVDHHATADGRGKTKAESTSRLARMFGYDAEELSSAHWQQVATFLVDEQMQPIKQALMRRLSTSGATSHDPEIIITGCGYLELAALALSNPKHKPPIAFHTLVKATNPTPADVNASAPAVAVAWLAAKTHLNATDGPAISPQA